MQDTAANAGATLAGARLATRSSKPEYLAFAKQAYAFWLSDLVDQPAFAVYDHQGVMIGAALELNAATGEAHYLDEAQGFGQYLISKATLSSSAGLVLDDGTPAAPTRFGLWRAIPPATTSRRHGRALPQAPARLPRRARPRWH